MIVAVGDAYVGIVGATVEDDVLFAAAAAVTVVGDRAAVPPDALPTGWRDLGDAHAFDLVPGASGVATTNAGPITWMAGYGRAGEGMIYLSAAPGDELRAAMPRLVAEEHEVVDVRGHDAVLARTPYAGSLETLSVTWQERPGEVLQLAAVTADIDADTLVALARGVESVDRADVPRLRREAMVAESTAAGVTVIGEGTFSDGTDWILIRRGDDGYLDLLSTSGGGSSSGGSTGIASSEGGPASTPVLGEYTAGSAGPVEYAHGPIGGDATVTVGVRPSATAGAGGGPVADVVVVEGDGVRAWVAELPPDVAAGAVYEAVGRDAAGVETGSIQIGA